MDSDVNRTPEVNESNSHASSPYAALYMPKPKRTFSAAESVFAWLCLLGGYAFCRVFPVILHPMGGFLLIWAAFAATAVILRLKKAAFGLPSVIAAVSALAVSASLILCANPILHFFAYAYSLAAYIYFVYAATGNALERGLSDLILADFFKAAFLLPFSSFTHLFRAAFSGKANTGGRLLLKLLIGVLIAVIPTTAVLLLLSYDSGFTELLHGLFRFSWGSIFSHLASLLLGIPVGMYLFGLFLSCADKKCADTLTAESCRKTAESIRIAPAATVMAAALPLLTVYLIFFISQWKYYISGFSGLLPDSLSYAQYARDGFFQLCAVSVINLAALSAVSLFMRRKGKASSILLRALSIVFCVFTLALISTAAAKMIMYIHSYGLTPKRVYAAWLMAVLAALFLLALIKQFAPKLKLLPLSVAICALFFACLSLSDTDALIARYNVDRYLNGSLERIDIADMESLGDSAIPQLVRLAKALDERNGTDIAAITPSALSGDALYRELAVTLYSFAEKEPSGFFAFTVPKMKAQAAVKDAGIYENSERWRSLSRSDFLSRSASAATQ